MILSRYSVVIDRHSTLPVDDLYLELNWRVNSRSRCSVNLKWHSEETQWWRGQLWYRHTFINPLSPLLLAGFNVRVLRAETISRVLECQAHRRKARTELG